jgi:hypothetical protein
VAEIASYVRSSWGNDAPNVSADEVAKVRKIVMAKYPSSPQARPAGLFCARKTPPGRQRHVPFQINALVHRFAQSPDRE